MTDAQVKHLAIAKLAESGITIAETSTFREITNAIEKVTGYRPQYNVGLADYVRAWAMPTRSTRYIAPFRPMTSHAHPRQADIDRDQPPMMTPNGIGNDKQPGGFRPVV